MSYVPFVCREENSLENCVFSREEKRFPGTGRTIVGIFLAEKRKRKRREEEEGKEEEEEEGEGAVGMLDAFSRGRRRQFRFRRFNLSRIGRRRCVFWELDELRPGKLSEILYRELISRKYRGGSREASLRGERKLILENPSFQSLQTLVKRITIFNLTVRPGTGDKRSFRVEDSS